MLPKVSRKNNRGSGTVGGELATQRWATVVISRLQINLKKILSGYYRAFLAHYPGPYLCEYMLSIHKIIKPLNTGAVVIYRVAWSKVVRDINDNFGYFCRKCY